MSAGHHTASRRQRARSQVERFLQRHPIGSLSVLVGIITAAMLWIRYWSVLQKPFWVTGDLASDSIIVSLAKRLRLNHGHYSQFAFFHPGTAMFYFEAFGQWLFYNVLHLFPTESNAQLATLFLANAALIAGSAFCLGVLFKSPRVVVATAFGILLYAANPTKIFIQSGPALIAQLWVPTQTIWCFVFFLCALAYVVAKKPSAFVVVAVASVLLAQRYLGLVPVAFFGMVVGFIAAWRTQGATKKRDLRNGILAAVILCLPNILGVIVDWPWQFSNYARASVHQIHAARGVRSTVRFVGDFWGIHNPYVFLLFMALLAVIAYWLWKRPSSTARNGYLVLLVLVLTSTAVALIFAYLVSSDISQLSAYELSFYDGVPAVAYAIVSILLLRWVLAYLAFAAVLLFANFGAMPPTNSNVPLAQQAIDKAAHGRPIEYIAQSSAASWPSIAALLLVDIRSGVNACAQETSPQDFFLYTPNYVCTAASSVGRVQFLINPITPVPGAITVFSSPDITVEQLPST